MANRILASAKRLAVPVAVGLGSGFGSYELADTLANYVWPLKDTVFAGNSSPVDAAVLAAGAAVGVLGAAGVACWQYANDRRTVLGAYKPGMTADELFDATGVPTGRAGRILGKKDYQR